MKLPAIFEIPGNIPQSAVVQIREQLAEAIARGKPIILTVGIRLVRPESFVKPPLMYWRGENAEL